MEEKEFIDPDDFVDLPPDAQAKFFDTAKSSGELTFTDITVAGTNTETSNTSQTNQSSTTSPERSLTEDAQPSGGFLGGFFKGFGRKKEAALPEYTATTTPSTGRDAKIESSVDEYLKYLEMSSQLNFNEEKKLGFLYRSGIDTLGRPIIVFVAAYLPGKDIDPDRLLLYIINEMDSIVVRDYTLVYVHSYFSSQNRPPFAWLRKAYRILSRKYKKNLKALYIVHPTFWIKTTFKLFRPFLSQKFWQKLVYINEVSELYKYIHRDQLQLPNIVYQYGVDKQKLEPIFGAPLGEVLERPDHMNAEVPVVVEKSVHYLMERKANQIQGIFRLSGSSQIVQQLRTGFDKGDNPSFDSVEDPHVIAGLLKLYLRELPEPLFPFDMYDRLIQNYVANKNNIVPTLTTMLSDLPGPNKALLRYLLELLAYIEKNSEVNKMTSSNLSIVFAPNLIRAPKESIQQAVMHAPIVNSIMRAIVENHEKLLPVLKTSKDHIED